MMDLFDAFQQGMINSAKSKAEQAKRDSEHTASRLHFHVQHLEAKIDGLALVCEGLWELVRERTDLTDDDIQAKIEQIDRRDGVRDGKIGGAPTVCSKCARPGHTRQAVCMYCGNAL